MDREEFEGALREIRLLRQQGLITPQEARLRHEALIAAANPEPAPELAVAIDPADTPSTGKNLLMGTALLVLLAVAAVTMAMVYLHLNPGKKAAASSSSAAAVAVAVPPTFAIAGAGSTATRTPPTPAPATRVPPTVVPQSTATPASGCYSVSSPDDTLELVSVDPPLDGPPPTGPVRITVRYSLASHDHARLALSAGSGQVSSSVALDVDVPKGRGLVSIQQATLPDPGSPTYSVFLQPPVEAYRALGYTCWKPLAMLRFSYNR